MSLYLVRYYDWDYNSGRTIGLFKSMTDVHAYLCDEWEGCFEDAAVVEPQPNKYIVRKYPITSVKIDGGDYGKKIEIERLEIDL